MALVAFLVVAANMGPANFFPGDLGLGFDRSVADLVLDFATGFYDCSAGFLDVALDVSFNMAGQPGEESNLFLALGFSAVVGAGHQKAEGDQEAYDHFHRGSYHTHFSLQKLWVKVLIDV